MEMDFKNHGKMKCMCLKGCLIKESHNQKEYEYKNGSRCL